MPLTAAAPLAAPPDLRELAEDVLLAIARVRFASVPSLLGFAGADGLTAELLAGWSAAGLLHRGAVRLDPLCGPEVEYVALAPAGARALAAATGRAPLPITSARMKRTSQKRSHDVMVGDFGLAVLRLAKKGRIALLGLECDDRKIATSVVLAAPGLAPSRLALQADLLVMVRDERGLVALLVEVDRGTIAPAKMTERYRGYFAWLHEHGPERDFSVRALQVATVVPDARRLEKLHAAGLAANDGKRSGFLLFALQPDVEPMYAERLLEPIARALSPGLPIWTPLLPSHSSRSDLGTPRSPGPPPAADERAVLPRMKSFSFDLGIPPSRSHALAGAASPQAPLL